ncbi:hypothetical protein PWG71_25935 [Nocardiopsis sp. N85]|uniref:hypothetical protein n=1 Tax=Nocardiopsis sp. N85 TaxID=3029400 RepID=UPI00237F7178|nr:hypothetical protein [Nocardiopsis sp. N85]MDE3724842.1 hypothetical protein [Nocardiopsis sp. N85]
MKRRTLIGVIGVGLAVLPVGWALRQAVNGTKEDWRTDTAPLERAFPGLGSLTDAKWVSTRDNDRLLQTPDLVFAGFARLSPGKLDELTTSHAFVSEEPTFDFSSGFTKPLADEGPDDPQWIRSPELDRSSDNHSTSLWFDRRSDTVRFWASNPYG